MQYITSNDGTKIAVYDYNPHDCTQEKQTILLIHGWPLSHLIFEYQINLLTDCGYRVVAVDFYNGFGVCKLILLSAAAPCFTKRPGFPYGKTVQEVNDLISLAQTDRPQLCQNFSQQLFACPHSDAVVDWFKSIALSASGIGTIKCGIALRDEDVRDAFSCVHVPTYIIHGEKDLIVSNELAEIQHKCICGSKLITLSGSGHGIVYDQLDKFNAIFMDCIAE